MMHKGSGIVRSMRAIWRGTRLIGHIIAGLCVGLLLRLDFTGRLQPEHAAAWWSRKALRILNIHVRVHGQAVTGPHVTVANHVSWLDIPLLAIGGNARFVAKSEIRDWPIAGWLANAAGTFYIRRGKGGARPLLERLQPHLRAGGSVTLFPEGTTSDGHTLLPFHARLLGSAIDASVPVQPVALRYGQDAQGRDIAPFIGDDDLFHHILRLLGTPSLRADVIYCPPVMPSGMDRDALADAARAHVATALWPSSVRTTAPDLANRMAA